MRESVQMKERSMKSEHLPMTSAQLVPCIAIAFMSVCSARSCRVLIGSLALWIDGLLKTYNNYIPECFTDLTNL